MADKLYDKSSIEHLSPLEFTRLKPGVYCGDTTYSTQLLVEIVSNAVDEYRLGHGSTITVDIAGTTISVIDNGQGFLVNQKMEGTDMTILEAAFSELNTSGKYREDGTYEGTSLGSFGIGSKITTYLSHWLDVTTCRDGKSENILFEEGVFKKRTVNTGHKDSQHGTRVTWQPSEQFFTHPEVEMNKVRSLFKTIVCLCPGLTIKLIDNGKEENFYSKNGLNDLADAAIGDAEIIKNRLEIKFENNKNKMDMVLTYTDKYSSTIVPYVNTGLTDSGPHITQIKTVITREFNKFFREKKWLKDKEENLTGDDIQEGMYIVFNITTSGVSYDAQVKSRITKIDMSPFTQALVENLQIWLNQNEKEIKAIADKSINARKAREAAKKARDAARNKTKKKEKVVKFDSKLADCSSKDRQKCEIFITEGDSASGGMKLARDNSYQAVLPVRGKILNCQKATIAQIQKNAEIMTMLEAFGLEIDVKSMKVIYNESDLRYGSIIIASDADVDGAHIKNLFYTFIWNFAPELIINGHIYASQPPLYKVTFAGNKGYKYIKNDEELEKFREANKGTKYEVGRMKGLGEMDPEELEETMLNPDNRIIKQITMEDMGKAKRLFEDLMGDKVLPRKEYIEKHSEETYYNQE